MTVNHDHKRMAQKGHNGLRPWPKSLLKHNVSLIVTRGEFFLTCSQDVKGPIVVNGESLESGSVCIKSLAVEVDFLACKPDFSLVAQSSLVCW